MTRTYRRKSETPVVAVQLPRHSPTPSGGGEQNAKAGDWLLDNDGDVYTCDASVFAETYRQTATPGHYVKVSTVEAFEATDAGSVETLEGASVYAAGDFIVTNPSGDTYPVPAEKFHALYEVTDA